MTPRKLWWEPCWTFESNAVKIIEWLPGASLRNRDVTHSRVVSGTETPAQQEGDFGEAVFTVQRNSDVTTGARLVEGHSGPAGACAAGSFPGMVSRVLAPGRFLISPTATTFSFSLVLLCLFFFLAALCRGFAVPSLVPRLRLLSWDPAVPGAAGRTRTRFHGT